MFAALKTTNKITDYGLLEYGTV